MAHNNKKQIKEMNFIPLVCVSCPRQNIEVLQAMQCRTLHIQGQIPIFHS